MVEISFIEACVKVHTTARTVLEMGAVTEEILSAYHKQPNTGVVDYKGEVDGIITINIIVTPPREMKKDD